MQTNSKCMSCRELHLTSMSDHDHDDDGNSDDDKPPASRHNDDDDDNDHDDKRRPPIAVARTSALGRMRRQQHNCAHSTH